MSVRVGKDCKVTLGANTVVAIGNWSIDGQSRQEIESTAFGDEYATYELGIIESGTISFSGHYDPDDTTGQLTLVEAFDAASSLTNLFLYVDNTSRFEPCQTTSYLHPSATDSAGTKLSSVRITSANASVDKGGLVAIDFTAKVSGSMVLV